MNGSETHVHPAHRHIPDRIASGSVTEGIGAISVIVLAILGLSGVLTNVVASIGTIVAGLVFLADGMLAASTVQTLHLHSTQSGIGSGASAGFFAGLAAIILGVLSFFQAMPARMLSVAVLAMGGSLFLSGGMLARLNALLQHPQGSWVGLDSGGAFIGLAVSVLGILGIIGIVPMTLALVGLLCLGAGALFSSAPTEAQT
jgi:hypothetical protein